jgi:protein SCO1
MVVLAKSVGVFRARSGRIGLLGLLFVVSLMVGGCGFGPQEEELGYALEGVVREVIPERTALIVRHEAIRGYKEAGETEFKVSAGDLANAVVGKEIRGRVMEHSGAVYLDRIWRVDRMSQGILDRTGRQLMEDTIVRGSRSFREVGEVIPAFALYDQTGTVVQVNRYRGRNLALNFIYTRCPSPQMCPAATQRMIQLQQAAREAGVENFELVSITLDPDYDTPGVLREYAERNGIDTSNFSFLTGPDSAIQNLMEQFGILVDPEIGFESHTLGTMLVDSRGTIRHRVFGSNWMVGDFMDRLLMIEAAARDEE